MKYQDVNYNFFEKIDSEEKAYFLGFMYSDGCVQSNSISIKIHNKDVSILQKLRDLISPSTPIKITKNKYCYFRINRKPICQQLIVLGCIPNKSLTLTFPPESQVPKHLIRHFIRGYSDGDGTIKYTTLKTGRKDFCWSVTSTYSFCQSLAQQLKELNVNCYIHLADTNKNNTITHNLSVGGSIQLSTALNWIYSDASIYMQRKYDKYIEFKDQIASNELQSRFAARGSFKLNEQQIVDLYQQENNKNQISKLINCSPKTIKHILTKHNIKNKPYHRQNTINSKSKEIYLLYNQGMSVKNIAEKYKCTTNNITIILKQYNVKYSNSKKILSQAEIDLILDLRKQGLGSSKIAKQLGYSKSFISRFLKGINK